ncbi:MAG: DUF1049 domain-containing protein [Nitrosomonadales bacterium]|nr:MAG: DUF1049 domain-containing protein [Nitrosomonadales bacterium]
MQLLTIVAILFSIGGVMFALQNNVPVTVNFLLWRLDSSLAMVLLIALALGGIIFALVSAPSTLRRHWTLAKQQKRIEELEKAHNALEKKLAESLKADQNNSSPVLDPASPEGTSHHR